MNSTILGCHQNLTIAGILFNHHYMNPPFIISLDLPSKSSSDLQFSLDERNNVEFLKDFFRYRGCLSSNFIYETIVKLVLNFYIYCHNFSWNLCSATKLCPCLPYFLFFRIVACFWSYIIFLRYCLWLAFQFGSLFFLPFYSLQLQGPTSFSFAAKYDRCSLFYYCKRKRKWDKVKLLLMCFLVRPHSCYNMIISPFQLLLSGATAAAGLLARCGSVAAGTDAARQ